MQPWGLSRVASQDKIKFDIKIPKASQEFNVITKTNSEKLNSKNYHEEMKTFCHKEIFITNPFSKPQVLIISPK